MTDLNEWAVNLTKSIYLKYQENETLKNIDNGVKVFYSPVAENTKLMIIGYQPGGNDEHYAREDKNAFEDGDFRLPKQNIYIVNPGRMAQTLRDKVFSFVGGIQMLESSIAFNLIFFRAPSIGIWRSYLPNNETDNIEKFCFVKTKEIIKKLKPQMIMVLGMQTYDILKNSMFSKLIKKETIYKFGRQRRLAIITETSNQNIFTIIHPSGAQVSDKDWLAIKELFKEQIGQYLLISP